MQMAPAVLGRQGLHNVVQLHNRVSAHCRSRRPIGFIGRRPGPSASYETMTCRRLKAFNGYLLMIARNVCLLHASARSACRGSSTSGSMFSPGTTTLMVVRRPSAEWKRCHTPGPGTMTNMPAPIVIRPRGPSSSTMSRTVLPPAPRPARPRDGSPNGQLFPADLPRSSSPSR